jgi:hypothetical protein
LEVLVDTIQKSGEETRVNRYSSTRHRSQLHQTTGNHRSDHSFWRTQFPFSRTSLSPSE